jgi:hypothetical protein
MTVTQDNNEIQLSQEHYTHTLVEEYPQACNTNSPGCPRKVLGEGTGPTMDFPYRMLCGKLWYLTVTHPDIEFPLNQCCKYQENPKREHVTALLRIIRYLKKYPKMEIVYKKRYLENPTITVEGYCDSSFADQAERHWSYRFALNVAGCAVSWKSCTTPKVATSSTHAEYVALAELLKEELHVMYLLQDMGFVVEKPMSTSTNSSGAIRVAKFKKVNNQTKHIDVR